MIGQLCHLVTFQAAGSLEEFFFSCLGDFLANCLRHVRGMSSSPLGFPDEPMDHQVDLVWTYDR